MIIMEPERFDGLLHHRLIELLTHVSEMTGALYVTSIFREDSPGVHGTRPVRGIDLRCRNSQIGQSIADAVNADYQYDFERPHLQCAMAHDAGSGMHLHLQVHPNTRWRMTHDEEN